MTIRDIERLLIDHPSVQELCSVNPPGDVRKKHYWVFVVLTEIAPEVIYDFHIYCTTHLIGASVDAKVRILSALPKSPSGVVSRRELAALCAQQVVPASTTTMCEAC